MKKSLIVLFSLRLFLYFSVIILILIHPGIAVSFDSVGIIQWFLVVPLMAGIAFIPNDVFKLHYRRIAAIALLFIASIISGVTTLGMLQFFAVGLVSFTLTCMLFDQSIMRSHTRWSKIAAIEPFFLAYICLRLLSLSRSNEDIAGQSEMLTQFILIWTAAVFLLHSVIVYLCLYPEGCRKIWKEAAVFFSSAFAILIVLLFVLPPDFVRNAVIENLAPERIPKMISRENNDNGIPERGDGRRTLPNGEGGGRGELRGLSEYDWPGMGGGRSGERRQYMVMIVASETEPVYMADAFRGSLDPVQGFMLSRDEPLNDLVNQRFFVTWKDSAQETDRGRRRQAVFALSTLQQKHLPYRPVAIDPVILNENSGPLRYIHQVESNMHSGDPLELVNTSSRRFNDKEILALSHYMEAPLSDNDKKKFEEYLNNALNDWLINKNSIIQNDRYLTGIFSNRQNQSGTNQYIETIIALLVSFSMYQYDINPDDDHSIDALKNFLFNSNTGDCVEFSNTLALLGRLAGIPSRVVTGYLAAEGLQTPAHLRGLKTLQSQIPVLQDFPFDHLFMVTNIHRHSWTQFFIPNYGWLDFESTSFSLPPTGMGDFNNWDVVIPILDKDRTLSQFKKFPWQAVGRTSLAVLILAVICAYILLYGRMLILYMGSKKGGKSGTRSLYLLLLARLAADGRPIKPASKTAHEYRELFAEDLTRKHKDPEEFNNNFIKFADIYSEIRWKEFSDQSELDNRFEMLKAEYRNILKTTKKKGLHHSFKRIINLRGLAYL